MYGLREMLLKEQNHLATLRNALKEEKRTYPEGSLRTLERGGQYQYFHYIPGKTGDHGRYIHKKEEELARVLAQKDYERKLERLLERRLNQIEKLTKEYRDDELEQLFLGQVKSRRRLIDPIEPTYEERLFRWETEENEGKGFRDGDPVIFTEKGERVRSKSEKILADFFCKKGIPYKYEKPLYLATKK